MGGLVSLVIESKKLLDIIENGRQLLYHISQKTIETDPFQTGEPLRDTVESKWPFYTIIVCFYIDLVGSDAFLVSFQSIKSLSAPFSFHYYSSSPSRVDI